MSQLPLPIESDKIPVKKITVWVLLRELIKMLKETDVVDKEGCSIAAKYNSK